MESVRFHFNKIAISILLLAGLWIAYTSIFIPVSSPESNASIPREGFNAPDFSLTTLDAVEIQLSSLRGKVVFINFWTSWCPACKQEMPAIQELHEESPDIIVLAINATDQDKLEDVDQFVNEHSITFDVLLDKDGIVSRLYQVKALPTSFFIDKEGVIRKVVYGGPIAKSLLLAEISALIEEP